MGGGRQDATYTENNIRRPLPSRWTDPLACGTSSTDGLWISAGSYDKVGLMKARLIFLSIIVAAKLLYHSGWDGVLIHNTNLGGCATFLLVAFLLSAVIGLFVPQDRTPPAPT